MADVDFNAKYGLKPDPVLAAQELLQPNFLSAGFARVDTGQLLSLEDWQEQLSTILLIPPVPETVRRTFGIAKRLYLFGYFEYGFYTVAQHYAFLALEAAVYSRWVRTLPNPATIQAGDHQPQQMPEPTHYKMFEIWESCDRKLRVEGEPFPNSVSKVLGRLEAKGIVRPDERVRLDAAMDLRNTFSHLEFAPVVTPAVLDGIYITAQLINTIYDRS